ncbi:MAG: DUF4388 domain-containing protein [Planctomycetota bacterium]
MESGESKLVRELPDALRKLADSGACGVVRIRADEGMARLTVANGKVLFATSTRAVPIGRVLVQKGVLTEDALRGVLRVQKSRTFAQPLGTILYELGLISGRVADEEIAMHVAGIVHDVLQWTDGSYEFRGESVSTDGVLASDCLDIDRILLQVRLLA